MKIEIISKKQNPFLKREEMIVSIVHEKEATPRKAALQQLLSKEVGKEPEHIEIKNIFSEKGEQASKSKVFVWEEKKAKDLSKEVKKEAKGKNDKGEKTEEKQEGKQDETKAETKDEVNKKGKETKSEAKNEKENLDKEEHKSENEEKGQVKETQKSNISTNNSGDK